MSHVLTVGLSDEAHAELERLAKVAATSPTELASSALEQRFRVPEVLRGPGPSTTEENRRAARERFERHFGAVNLGGPTGADNEAIDADLARSYADGHEES